MKKKMEKKNEGETFRATLTKGENEKRKKKTKKRKKIKEMK